MAGIEFQVSIKVIIVLYKEPSSDHESKLVMSMHSKPRSVCIELMPEFSAAEKKIEIKEERLKLIYSLCCYLLI